MNGDYFEGNNFRRKNKPFWLGLLNDFFGSLSLTGWLILANILFFILEILIGILNSGDCGAGVCRYFAIQPENFLSKGYFWTPLTSMFMHGSFLHLILNMVALLSLGSLSERIIGKKRFIGFYIFSGLFAGLLFVFLSGFFGSSEIGMKIFGSPLSYAVGASGAIFAIAGLFVVLTPKMRFSFIFLPFFSLPAYIMVPLVLFATWLVSSSTGFPVGNTAHLGGFLVGLLYGFYLKRKFKRKTKMIAEIFS